MIRFTVYFHSFVTFKLQYKFILMLNQIAHAAGLLLLQIFSRIVITFFHFNIVPVNGFNQVSFLSIFSPGLSGLDQFSQNCVKVDPKSQSGEGPYIYLVSV